MSQRPPARLRGRVARIGMVVAGLALGAVIAHADSPPTRPGIEDLELGRDDDGVRVSFRVARAFDDDAIERIHSGMRLDFEHRVFLLGRRMAPLFPRITIGKTVVVTTVRYDTLTRRYDLERRVIGKGWPKSETPPERVESRSTLSRDEMETWMTVLHDVPLPAPPEGKDQPLKVRVRTDLGIRFLLMFLPWPDTVVGEAWLEP